MLKKNLGAKDIAFFMTDEDISGGQCCSVFKLCHQIRIKPKHDKNHHATHDLPFLVNPFNIV